MPESLDQLRAAEDEACREMHKALLSLGELDEDDPTRQLAVTFGAERTKAYRTAVRATQLAEIQGMDRIMRAVVHHEPPPPAGTA